MILRLLVFHGKCHSNMWTKKEKELENCLRKVNVISLGPDQ